VSQLPDHTTLTAARKAYDAASETITNLIGDVKTFADEQGSTPPAERGPAPTLAELGALCSFANLLKTEVESLAQDVPDLFEVLYDVDLLRLDSEVSGTDS
jgi:hypothetical protein